MIAFIKSHRHTWEKWSAITNTAYETKNNGLVTLPTSYQIYAWPGLQFNPSTGIYMVTGTRQYGWPATLLNNNVPYTFFGASNVTTGTSVYKLEKQGNVVKARYYTRQQKTVYAKGSTRYENVFSDDPDAYPADGYKDGYYYIRIS